jgi:hypothetical protein
MTFTMEYTDHAQMHSATFYRVVALAVPALLVGLGRASHRRFGATGVAAVYTAVYLILLWTFPLVPASPRLGPVYVPVTHLIPAGFPLLLVFPAVAMDLLDERLLDARRSAVGPTTRAALLGLTFLALFALVQWPFATFLVSPASENWIFGTGYHDYNTHPSWASMHHQFYAMERTARGFAVEAAAAVLAAIASTRLGLLLREGLVAVRR